MNRFFRMFSIDQGEPTLLDHIDKPTDEEKAEAARIAKRHADKLAEAARRYGKPFKCAREGVPREVVRDGVPVATGSNVTRLPARKA